MNQTSIGSIHVEWGINATAHIVDDPVIFNAY